MRPSSAEPRSKGAYSTYPHRCFLVSRQKKKFLLKCLACDSICLWESAITAVSFTLKSFFSTKKTTYYLRTYTITKLFSVKNKKLTFFPSQVTRVRSSSLTGTPSLVHVTSGIGFPMKGAEMTNGEPSSTDSARSGLMNAGRASGSPAMPFSANQPEQFEM